MRIVCGLTVWAAVAAGLCALGAQQLASPLPAPLQLMQEVEQHQRQLDKVREDYTYTSLVTTEDVDSGGRVTKTEVMENEQFFVNGHQIQRTVKKNGKPLEGKELDQETERVTRRVELAQSRPAGQVLDMHTLSIRKLLETMDVNNPRRQNFRGRPTILFDFAGRRNARTHGLEEDLSKKLEGTLWIDEADRQVAHIEVRFNDNFRVAGGIVASIQRGSNFSFDQAPVSGGLWLPTGGEGSVEARFLLVKGLRQRFHERDFDYKRFHAEALPGKDAHVVGK